MKIPGNGWVGRWTSDGDGVYREPHCVTVEGVRYVIVARNGVLLALRTNDGDYSAVDVAVAEKLVRTEYLGGSLQAGHVVELSRLREWAGAARWTDNPERRAGWVDDGRRSIGIDRTILAWALARMPGTSVIVEVTQAFEVTRKLDRVLVRGDEWSAVVMALRADYMKYDHADATRFQLREPVTA